MRISKNSWMAKVYHHAYGMETLLPNSLCTFFWSLVWALVKLLFVVAILLSCAATILTFVYYMFACFFVHTEENLIVGGFSWLITLSILVNWLYLRLKRSRKDYNKSRKYIIVEYTKAIFRRVCPRIDWY